MGRLKGKVAIVTGGARGMGAATVRLFAAEGATVVATDILEAEGRATVETVGPAASFRRHDVRDEIGWRSLVGEIAERHGRIDILVNNAGIVHFSVIEEMVKEDVEHVLGVNVVGPLLGMKHVGAVMKRQRAGSIINISSVDGLRGSNGLGAYTASKWALRGLSKSAAMEFGPHGVRVNSIHPGPVNTMMGNPEGKPVEELNKFFGDVPLQRVAAPEEIARASLFLASDDASYVSGAELAVDGAWGAGDYLTLLPGTPPGMKPPPG
jgi:3alpha(or 20beta)-hydroxysteroid dehydrogenase